MQERFVFDIWSRHPKDLGVTTMVGLVGADVVPDDLVRGRSRCFVESVYKIYGIPFTMDFRRVHVSI